VILLLFPFQGEMTYFLGPERKIVSYEKETPSVGIPAGRSDWRVAVCGQGKVEAALAAQSLAARLSPRVFLLIGAATALDPALRVGDIVLADPCIEWDFGNAEMAGRPTFPKCVPLPEDGEVTQALPLRMGPVLSGDRDVFDPLEKASLRERYRALALAWEGAGFHRFLRRNRALGWELRLITEEAGEGRPTLALMKERMTAGFPKVRKVVEALF
jgi:adenosylhomocysteine nucleosidase